MTPGEDSLRTRTPNPDSQARQCFTCSGIGPCIDCSACGEPVCAQCIVDGKHKHFPEVI